MDILFIILLVGMLVLVGYAKMQQGVAKTTGTISRKNDDEDGLLN